MTPIAPSLPFPIFQVSQKVKRYMLYDINTVTWLRRAYNILGVLIGTLPQIPSQNVFLSLPLELQPEEALLLVEKGLAYIVDDQDWHRASIGPDHAARKDQIRDSLRKEGIEIAKDIGRKRQARTQKVLKDKEAGQARKKNRSEETPDTGEELFPQDSPGQEEYPGLSRNSSTAPTIQPWAMTQASSTATSELPLPRNASILPDVNDSSYALFRHLHQHGYFMTPGLRFGCQFSVYPGDPLRFHSHFLAVSAGWDEEIDLLHLIGGGRLGTGVKKGWMIGGIESGEQERTSTEEGSTTPANTGVRTFCIEWGGM